MSSPRSKSLRTALVALALGSVAAAPVLAQEVVVTAPRPMLEVVVGAEPRSVTAEAAAEALAHRTLGAVERVVVPAPGSVVVSDVDADDDEAEEARGEHRRSGGGHAHPTYRFSERSAENRLAHLAARLSLSAEQIESVRAILASARAEARELRGARHGAAREALADTVRARIEAVLTDAQRAAWADERAERHAERAERTAPTTGAAARSAAAAERRGTRDGRSAATRERHEARAEHATGERREAHASRGAPAAERSAAAREGRDAGRGRASR